jgi:tetratricopeptide (TPR) repeat protein
MKKKIFTIFNAGLLILLFSSFGATSTHLPELVKKIQPAVVKIVVYDMNKQVSGIGSGFFINSQGHLITNFHVLNGAFSAEVIAQDGSKYSIDLMIAQNPYADLVKVSVDIPHMFVEWLKVVDAIPSIAEQVLVVGSPLGLEQSVSEGIVSAVREIPNLGKFFQTTAPISPGSSGSPVLNMDGHVIGIVSFQSVMGQNINFAVPSKKVLELDDEAPGQTLAEWTYGISNQKPKLAAELCRKGFQFSINGEFKKALSYYKNATEKDPTDIVAWYGLSQCYVGLGKSEAVVETYKEAIRINVKDASLHFNLGNYYRNLGKNTEAIKAYTAAIQINPDDSSSYDRLGILYSEMGQYRNAIEAHKQVTVINPRSAPAHFHIGTAHAQLGELEAAVESYKKAVLINSEFGQAYNSLGTALGKLGKHSEEMGAYKRAIQIDPEDPEAHYNIGAAYAQKGDREDALQEYKILKGLAPEKADALFKRIYD